MNRVWPAGCQTKHSWPPNFLVSFAPAAECRPAPTAHVHVSRQEDLSRADGSGYLLPLQWENHFCRVACFFEFVKKHFTDIVALAPVHEPSETPIDVEVIKHPEETTSYGWTRKAWTEKKIVPIENNQ